MEHRPLFHAFYYLPTPFLPHPSTLIHIHCLSPRLCNYDVVSLPSPPPYWLTFSVYPHISYQAPLWGYHVSSPCVWKSSALAKGQLDYIWAWEYYPRVITVLLINLSPYVPSFHNPYWFTFTLYPHVAIFILFLDECLFSCPYFTFTLHSLRLYDVLV